MAVTELPRERWQSSFDQVSKSLHGQRVKVEVVGPGDLGDRIAADWIALQGLTFDPHDDALTVFADGLEHRVRHPSRIDVEAEGVSVSSVQAVDGEGRRHIVLLSEPLSLPAP